MTTLDHDATTFAENAIAGILASRPELRRVDGGVARRVHRDERRVAVVIGGGSGHYPAFAGLVGSGLATAAACGNIFASPSASQVYRVAHTAENGAGVLLTFGNYAGDVLNFGQAAERLRADGIPVRELPVSDDVASANNDDESHRRGIAGDLIVFKVAGASAERGDDLDTVAQLATRANARTRSFGVAFAGCTLPGAQAPLFEVADKTMAVGLGIHGEPGIDDVPLPTVSELATLLVDRLLAAAPADAGSRTVAILNGLGLFKYEELYVLYHMVSRRLAAVGVDLILPEVGEFVTSLDMNGVSLTLFWPDHELEALWAAPAESAAYTRFERIAVDAESDTGKVAIAEEHSSDRRHAIAVPQALALLSALRDVVVESEDEFGRLDAVAGDGDHGIGMSRGVLGAVVAAQRAADRGAGIGPFLIEAGDGWSDRAGGTSGALWGVTLTALGASLAEAGTIDVGAAAQAARKALDAVQRLGGARAGDKTMIDAFIPYVCALEEAADSLLPASEALARAATAAEEAAEATALLRPKIGRARPLAEKSVGHPDAGAVSFARITRAVANTVGSPRAEKSAGDRDRDSDSGGAHHG